MTREESVSQFNEAADNLTYFEGGTPLVHINNFAEEIAEFGEAVANYLESDTEERRASLVKEWADVQVVLSNFAWFFSIDGQVAFNRVHSNNMSKLTDGKIVRRDDGKVLKPEGYTPVDMTGL